MPGCFFGFGGAGAGAGAEGLAIRLELDVELGVKNFPGSTGPETNLELDG